MKHAIPVLCIAFSWLVGCASQPLPAGDVAAAERAIAQARSSGAALWAPRELELAEKKIALTRRWIDAGDAAPARWLAQQAQVDAELAAVRAANAAARRTVTSRF
jgi:hypothetical protein